MPEALSHVAKDLSAEADRYQPRPLVAADLLPDHIGGLTYTGGTTGKPKGVMGTVRSITTMTTIQLAEWEWPANPKFLMCTPLSHAGAAFFTPTLIKGGQMFVLAKFDPAEVLKTIEEQRITATMLVPSMLYALMDHPDSRTRDLSSLETVYYGASAINPVRLAEAIERFGPIFAQYYGQSEAPMVITYLAKDEHDEKRLTSCGRPTVFARTALLDTDGNPVPQGEVGEICVSGPLLAGGYWNLPEETSRTFKDGWMHTGDMAREDSDGFWYIVDRVKDMIVTGGFNVFPREVEDVVAEHPAVAQVCVIGTPDEKWGEAVTAVIVLRPDAARDEASVATVTAEIQAAVKERKGSVQSPKQVVVVDSVPVTALGKPDKKAVRAQFWEGAGRARRLSFLREQTCKRPHARRVGRFRVCSACQQTHSPSGKVAERERETGYCGDRSDGVAEDRPPAEVHVGGHGHNRHGEKDHRHSVQRRLGGVSVAGHRFTSLRRVPWRSADIDRAQSPAASTSAGTCSVSTERFARRSGARICRAAPRRGIHARGRCPRRCGW